MAIPAQPGSPPASSFRARGRHARLANRFGREAGFGRPEPGGRQALGLDSRGRRQESLRPTLAAGRYRARTRFPGTRASSGHESERRARPHLRIANSGLRSLSCSFRVARQVRPAVLPLGARPVSGKNRAGASARRRPAEPSGARPQGRNCPVPLPEGRRARGSRPGRNLARAARSAGDFSAAEGGRHGRRALCSAYVCRAGYPGGESRRAPCGSRLVDRARRLEYSKAS